MQTQILPISDDIRKTISKGLNFQVLMRETPLKEWLTNIELANRLSGTLKKNASLGFRYDSQLTHEALCQTLGWGFESVLSTYLTLNSAVTEGDCHAITEVGWHVDRLLKVHPFDEDVFELKYINVQDKMGKIERQGIAVIVKETSVQWIKSGHLVFALLTQFSPATGQWSECINPF